MAYRRWPDNRRIVRREKPPPVTEKAPSRENEPVREVTGIPLPNISDGTASGSYMQERVHKSNIFDFLKNKIGLEEVILIGLIILVIDEGIEDEFILLMLVYILLF